MKAKEEYSHLKTVLMTAARWNYTFICTPEPKGGMRITFSGHGEAIVIEPGVPGKLLGIGLTPRSISMLETIIKYLCNNARTGDWTHTRIFTAELVYMVMDTLFKVDWFGYVYVNKLYREGLGK